MTLQIRNGNFYRNGVIIPVTIGDPEQIRVLREEIKRLEDFDSEGGLAVSLDIDERTVYTIATRFKCVCGFQVSYEDDNCEDDVDGDELHNRALSCYKCKEKYTLKWDKIDRQLYALRGEHKGKKINQGV